MSAIFVLGQSSSEVLSKTYRVANTMKPFFHSSYAWSSSQVGISILAWNTTEHWDSTIWPRAWSLWAASRVENVDGILARVRCSFIGTTWLTL
jgi:hypothetical protein